MMMTMMLALKGFVMTTTNETVTHGDATMRHIHDPHVSSVKNWKANKFTWTANGAI